MSWNATEFDGDSDPRMRAAQDDGRTPLALAAGLAAALVAGGIWAGLVFLTNMEIGYVAWGVGLLVGLAMSRLTANRTQGLAYAAALLAVVGLAAGKAFIFAGSAGMYAKQIEKDEASLRGAVAWHMYDARELDAQTLTAIDAAEASGDTISDALWASMNTQAGVKLEGMSEAQRHELAKSTASGAIQNMGMLAGIQAQLSLFDLLWLFLAVGTAFRMMAPEKTQPAPQPASV